MLLWHKYTKSQTNPIAMTHQIPYQIERYLTFFQTIPVFADKHSMKNIFQNLIYILLAALSVSSFTAYAESSPSKTGPAERLVAVIVNPTDYTQLIGDAVQQNTLASSIEAQFINRLLEKHFQVISRSKVRALYEETSFQRSPHTSGTGVAELGRLLNVSHVFVVEGIGSIEATVRTQYGNMFLCGLTTSLAQQHREARSVARKTCRTPTVAPAMFASLQLNYQLIEINTGRILATSSSEANKMLKNELELRKLAVQAVNRLKLPGSKVLR